MKPNKIKQALFLIVSVLIFTHVTSGPLWAAPVDDEDYIEGDGGAADNRDSEYHPGIGMGLPTYGGSGCQGGTLQAVLTQDLKTMSILFDDFTIEAGPNSNAVKAEKRCRVKIPFVVPAGYQVAIVKVDHRGYVDLPKKSRGVVKVRFHFSKRNMLNPMKKAFVRKRNFRGQVAKDFRLSSRVARGKRAWSKCGQNFDFSIVTVLRMNNRSRQWDALMAIDSIDAVLPKTKFHMKWRKCRGI